MTSKILVVALVGAGCVCAAGVGAYMAVRTSVAAPPAEAAAALEAPATPGRTSAPGDCEGCPDSSPARVDEAAVPAAIQASAASNASQAQPPDGNAANTPSRADAPRPRPGATQAPRRVAAAEPVAPARIAPPAPEAAPERVPDEPADPPESAPLPQPSTPAFDEAVVPAASVIGIRMDTSVTSETARIEDRVSARVTRDVKVDGRTVIPAGARLDGTVAVVERGGRIRSRARIGVRFDTLVLGDTDRIPIQTETIFRDGDSPANEASSKIGASAVVGSILGAVLGGRKGAAIGGAAGAAGGTAAVMASDRNAAAISAGSPLTVRLTTAVSVLVPHDAHDN